MRISRENCEIYLVRATTVRATSETVTTGFEWLKTPKAPDASVDEVTALVVVVKELVDNKGLTVVASKDAVSISEPLDNVTLSVTIVETVVVSNRIETADADEESSCGGVTVDDTLDLPSDKVDDNGTEVEVLSNDAVDSELSVFAATEQSSIKIQRILMKLFRGNE